MSNTITAYFKGRIGVAEAVYQNDYGIVMAFDSIDLPAHFDCYFSRLNQEEAVPGIGADNRVAIPNSVLANPGNVVIHIPMHTGTSDSEVEYVVYFKVIGRARSTDDGTPEQMTAIERALALLSQPITNIEEIVNEALSFTGDTFAEMKQELQDDFDNYTETLEGDLATWKGGVESDIDDVEHDFTVLQNQFDTAVAAVSTDTELTDIRVGDDEVIYTTAGLAVRTQFSNLKADFSDGLTAIKPIVYESKEITSNNNYIQTEEIANNSIIISGEIKASSGSITHASAVFAQGGKNLLPYMPNLNAAALGLTIEAIGNGGYRIHGTSTGTGNVCLIRSGAFPAVPLAPNMYIFANNNVAADGIAFTLWQGTSDYQSLSLASVDAVKSITLSAAWDGTESYLDGIQVYCSKANTAFDVTIYPVITFDYYHHEYDSPAKITKLYTDIVDASTVNINGFPLVNEQPCVIYTRTDATSYAVSVLAPTSTIKNTVDEMSEMLEVKVEATADQIIEGHFIQRDGAVSPSTTDWVCTDFLDISAIIGDEITISCTVDGYASLAFYDEDSSLISYISGDNASDYGITTSYNIQQFTISKPSGAYYARLSGREPSYTTPSQLFVSGRAYGDLGVRVNALEKKVNAIGGSLASKKVLVIGDSISADAYGNYKKWVTDLIDDGILTNSLVTNSSQHATGYLATYNSENNTFMDRLSAVADKSSYDLLVIYGGTNDYIQNIPMGTESGVATTEFAAAVKALFEYAIQNFTQARICVISPTRTYATWVNQQGLYETDYFSKIREIAKEYCFPTLNLTEESGFCPYIQTFRDMWTLLPSGYDTHDGVHPTAEYEKKYLAPMIRAFLESLI